MAGASGHGIQKEANLNRGGGGGGVSGGDYVIAAGPGGGGGAGGGVPVTSYFTPDEPDRESAARAYLSACGLKSTPDAVAQLTEVFLPCLKIMCERPWDPNGGTWRRSGRMGILSDVRKKFERLWERGWLAGKRHDDSGLDLINYLGFYMRSGKSHWGEWGNPASGPEE